MLRLWLGYEDLTRIRITPGLSPVGQTVLGAQASRGTGPAPLPGSWRSRTRTGLTGPSRFLLDLVPPGRCLPDFLTPYTRVPGLEPELDAVASTPVRRLRAELEQTYGPRPPASWLPRLAAGDGETMRILIRGLRDFHRAALADAWSELSAHQRAEASVHARRMAGGGIDGLLGGLHDAVRWTPPVLEIETLRAGDVRLQGRGLVITFSLFVAGPRVLVTADGPVTVVLPVPRPFTGAGRAPDALPKVLGRTRAAMIGLLGADGELTTGTLAARLGVSAPSASQHATSLRGAGLITSRRRGKTVLHTLTPLGERLLHGQGTRSRGGGDLNAARES
ncbi:winged helix-turn-helix domain-containing protein [Actinomadura viridis]|uniref:DNA-binding transcriptional ArsR family regulator n=1 Tax=Actinomadura viridis TaxID=58110 RepID=A0A931DQ22_9ACTN|nr:helix-turn-helix domain-containing protein [Actinomadura viridis]MBG6091932.1 DNA-binding transcriptional ArsR family regulator [Actinomadura viridis]